MQIFVFLSGLVLVAIAILDLLIMTLTVGGGGPLTSRISALVWGMALRLHRRRPRHSLLSVLGWTLLVGIAILWLALAWIGWTLIFSADPGAVVKATSLRPADFWERLYFIGYTLSTLGTGDYLPMQIPWQLATALVSANGFLLVTLAIAYLLPVVSAATEKRQLAVYLASLGGTSEEMVLQAWNGRGWGQFDQHLIAIAPLLTGLGESHLTYPVLHYFHSIEPSRSAVLSVAAFDEALTLFMYAVKASDRPDLAALRSARRASTAYLKTLKSAYIKPEGKQLPCPNLELLRAENIPLVDDETYRQATQQIAKHRQLLFSLIRQDGWSWKNITFEQTPRRGTSLEDYTTISKARLH